LSILTLITTTLLVIITLWTVYHLPILVVGIRCKGSKNKGNNNKIIKIKKYPRFSIIVPAKDEEAVIARCIEALLGQEYPKDRMEIIIVDGDSKDNTRKICEGYARKNPGLIKVIRQVDSRGKPAALNEALSHVKGEIIGVFDADNVPNSDVLIKVAKCFEDQSIKALQGRTTSINESENQVTRLAASEEKIWFQTLMLGRDELNLFVPLTGSCQFVRYETLMSVGGWREDSLAEDADLALKLTEKGHLIKYESEVKSWQETPSSLESLVKQRTRWYMGYLENLMRYGRLLRNPNRRIIDAELTLLGPGIMTLCVVTYLTSMIHLTFMKGEAMLPYATSVTLTTLTVSLIGLSLAYTEKPFRVTNLVWIPLIYLYWFLQTLIACWAFIQLTLRSPRVWNKTVKKGTVTEPRFLGV